MTVRIELEMPEGVFSSLRTSPERFGKELRLAAAAKWYELHLLSQSKAAEVAGVSRQEFIASLGRLGVSPVQTTPEEVEAEAKTSKSPFDVPGIKTAATTQDILEAIRTSRGGTHN